MAEFDDLVNQQAQINANQLAFDTFFSYYLAGTRDGTDSFDADGIPADDPDHGTLGYYPYTAPDGQVSYRACLDRLVADAQVATANAPAAKIGLVDMGQYVGHFAGQTGAYVLVPVVEQGVSLHLEQEQSIILPKIGTARALLFASPADDGILVTIGAANAPLPPPDGPSEPLDLGTGSLVYAPLGEITPLSISVPGGIGAFVIDVPEEMDLIVVTPYRIWVPVSVGMDFSEPSDPSHPTDGPWVIDGDGIAAPVYLNKNDTTPPTITWDGSNHPTVKVNTGFTAPALGIELPITNDPRTDRVPHRIALVVTGIIPNNQQGLVAWMTGGTTGGLFGMMCDFNGVTMWVAGPVGSNTAYIPYTTDPTEVHEYKMEYRDIAGGDTGTYELWVDGVSMGTTTIYKKPQINAGTQLYLNNAQGNFGPSINGITYHSVRIEFDRADTAYDLEPFSGTAISASEIVKLAVDARTVTEQQPLRTITYHAPAGPDATVDVVVGDVMLPAGRAYKAVLHTYPSGTSAPSVPHPNELVMTKFTVQNCRFEDAFLFQTQPSWSECIPQGPPPTVGDITYTCEGIRIGNYVQFQFGYHLSEEANPTEPFGQLDALGVETYMVPHKWYIYDQEGTLIGRVEQPNGEPLNNDQALPYWQGPWGVRNAAYTQPGDRYYPSGTIGSGVIWASHDLEDHDREEVEKRIPIPEGIIPYACHSDFSVNGFDLRLNFGPNGSDGATNGFANFRCMPYEPSDYQTWTSIPSPDPYDGLKHAAARGPNGAIWLKYTPFNIQGRSPVTGPGGVRDDRQAIAEPVSAYLTEPDGEHVVNGASYRQIAIDYCRGYVSDPFHLFERGRNVPLYKDQQNRPIDLNYHYYGPGNTSGSWANRFPIYIGRTSQWIASGNPLKVQPGAGYDTDHAWRGGFGIDVAHAHQFPGWGSLMWKTPEFAFLQAKFTDQVKMYFPEGGTIFGTNANDLINNMQSRDGAWVFLHHAMCWKLGSTNSQRLYKRAEIMEWMVGEFEYVYDMLFARSPGVLDLPAPGASDPVLNPRQLLNFVAFALFGMCIVQEGSLTTSQQTFMRAYWIHALGCAERMGFNDAMRAASEKAGAVLDWMIAMYRRAVCGHLTEVSTHLHQNSTYYNFLWSAADVASVLPYGDGSGQPIGNYNTLPQSYAALEARYGALPTWDYDPSEGSLDGQGMSGDLGAPFWLKYALKQTGPDIEAACAVARARIDQKKAEQEALGVNAGSSWFRYHQGTFTPIIPAP